DVPVVAAPSVPAIVIVPALPTVSVDRLHETMAVCVVQVKLGAATSVGVNPGGIASSTSTFVAVAGPALRTVIVYVVPPVRPAVGAGAAGLAATLLVRTRSVVGWTRKLVEAELSAATGSGVEEETVASLLSVVSLPVIVAVIVMVTVAWGGIGPSVHTT